MGAVTKLKLQKTCHECDLQREMARAVRVGRLARNQVDVLPAKVVRHDDEIESGGPCNLAQAEHPRVEASRLFEVGHDD